MKDFIYYNDLFELYSDLLTEKEQSEFKDYYYEDLSLAEIADNNRVSRAAVQKIIKTVEEKLDYYESILHLSEYKEKLNGALELSNSEDIKNVIKDVLS